jgi:hypothetical protein
MCTLQKYYYVIKCEARGDGKGNTFLTGEMKNVCNILVG